MGALVAILVGGQAAGKEAAAVALANLAVGSKDVAVRVLPADRKWVLLPWCCACWTASHSKSYETCMASLRPVHMLRP